MTEQAPAESETTRRAGFRHLLRVEIPTIKILLYADDPEDVTPSTAKAMPLGLGLMLEHLKAHEPASACLKFQYACRYSLEDPQAVNKIHQVLENEQRETGRPFDQIWFFGLQQVNLNEFSGGIFEGGPENELDEDEVKALRCWMRADEGEGFPGGGVLVTGDHSNARPTNAVPGTNPLCPDTGVEAEFLGLGRALGRCVPRAGLLRTWEGGPTNRPGDLNNTVESPGSEFDDKPQRLILRNVDDLGDPDPQGHPHPLFYYKPGQFIEVFPDHRHEGALQMPETFDPLVWPPALDGGAQPLPHVVACGINRRTSEQIDIIAAYQGDRAGVGRVVVDSTWHHYFNFNLRGFPLPPPEGSNADRIGQFYANLAVWLSPRSKRLKMALAIFWQLAKYTMRLERVPGDPEPELIMGQVAYNALAQVASPCEIHELLQVATPPQYGALNFPHGGLVLSHLPSREVLLGSIMCSYHEEILRARSAGDSYRPLRGDEVIASGFTRAFNFQFNKLRQNASDALKFIS